MKETEAVTRVGVTVTFLKMTERPTGPAPQLPENATVRLLRAPNNDEYRALQKQVGQPYLWWLRRVMPDAELASVLRGPQLAIHVLYLDGEPAGFYELDASHWPFVNLNYFGLMPHAIGRGLGTAFLHHAIDNAWSGPIRGMTVNTCTADHPRALPAYERAGFRRTRAIKEVWSIPDRLGFTIPDHLKV
ncbi:MAG TPA: GNAT family N-acetyltransferase [Acidisoma sp.]|nr:GNAT family N-acetyltransferase [Acidisoma sp.]